MDIDQDQKKRDFLSKIKIETATIKPTLDDATKHIEDLANYIVVCFHGDTDNLAESQIKSLQRAVVKEILFRVLSESNSENLTQLDIDKMYYCTLTESDVKHIGYFAFLGVKK